MSCQSCNENDNAKPLAQMSILHRYPNPTVKVPAFSRVSTPKLENSPHVENSPYMVNSFSPNVEKISTYGEVFSFNWCSHLMGGCRIWKPPKMNYSGDQDPLSYRSKKIFIVAMKEYTGNSSLFSIYGEY